MTSSKADSSLKATCRTLASRCTQTFTQLKPAIAAVQVCVLHTSPCITSFHTLRLWLTPSSKRLLMCTRQQRAKTSDAAPYQDLALAMRIAFTETPDEQGAMLCRSKPLLHDSAPSRLELDKITCTATKKQIQSASTRILIVSVAQRSDRGCSVKHSQSCARPPMM